MRTLLLVIEINLILWLIMVGVLMGDPSDTGDARTMALIGFGFAAVVQHWAYYRIRKKPG